jgi:hypothetical protein
MGDTVSGYPDETDKGVGMRILRGLMTATATAVALTLMTATAASAHECYIEPRSDQGNQGASNSGQWATVSIQTILSEFLGLPDPLYTCVLNQWTADGQPATFTFRTDKTIGEGSANPNLANGKGLEHAADVYEPIIGGYIDQCTN